MFIIYLEIQREKRGALNLNLPEKVISFDENGWPINVDTIYGTTSNKIIEELMILANVAAAEEIKKANYLLFTVFMNLLAKKNIKY